MVSNHHALPQRRRCNMRSSRPSSASRGPSSLPASRPACRRPAVRAPFRSGMHRRYRRTQPQQALLSRTSCMSWRSSCLSELPRDWRASRSQDSLSSLLMPVASMMSLRFTVWSLGSSPPGHLRIVGHSRTCHVPFRKRPLATRWQRVVAPLIFGACPRSRPRSSRSAHRACSPVPGRTSPTRSPSS